MPQTTELFDPWARKALTVAAVVMVVAAVVIFFPTHRATWILVAGAVVVIWMMLYHPEHWYRRMATLMLTAAIGLAALPMFKAQGELKAYGWFSVVMDSPPWVSIVLIFAAMATIVLDWQTRHRAPLPQEAKEVPPDSPPDPSVPQPRPGYTGIVEAYIMGTVWRARLHVGKAVDAKPVCPRHHVPLRPRELFSNDWCCTNPSCFYYRLMPELGTQATDKLAFLTGVYKIIEQRVREGVEYLVFPDDESAHI